MNCVVVDLHLGLGTYITTTVTHHQTNEYLYISISYSSAAACPCGQPWFVVVARGIGAFSRRTNLISVTAAGPMAIKLRS